MIHRRAALAGGFWALAGAAGAAAQASAKAWIAYEARLRARLADAGGGRFDAAAARALLGLTNAARANGQTPPVAWSDDLAETARAHAADLAGRGYVEHLSPEGFDPSDRLGLLARRMIGSTSENIAYHQGAQPADAAKLMHLWRGSPNHWKNLLSGRHSHAGFGVARKADRVYAVGLYAHPDGTLAQPLAFHARGAAEVRQAAAGRAWASAWSGWTTPRAANDRWRSRRSPRRRPASTNCSSSGDWTPEPMRC
ncbi:MAG: CAP domain-containing protein [Phenylobacterium sp.]